MNEQQLKCRCNPPGRDGQCPPGRLCGYLCAFLDRKSHWYELAGKPMFDDEAAYGGPSGFAPISR